MCSFAEFISIHMAGVFSHFSPASAYQVCLSMIKQESAYYVGGAGTDGRGMKLARHCGAGRCSLQMTEPLSKKSLPSHTLPVSIVMQLDNLKLIMCT